MPPHLLIFLINLMIISEDMENGVDKEYLKLFSRRVPMFLRLGEYPGLREDTLPYYFIMIDAKKIIEIVKREDISRIINTPVLSIERLNFGIWQEGNIESPLLYDIDFFSNSQEDELDPSEIDVKGFGSIDEVKGKHTTQ